MKKILLFLFCVPFLGITQNSYIINTSGNTFSPPSLIINVGDTVTWNNTSGFHNINAMQSTFPNNPQGFGNSVASAPWSFQWVFSLAGIYDYQCDPHVGVGMSGTVIVNIPGCTDILACNFDPFATIDDSSCVYFATPPNSFQGALNSSYYSVGDTVDLFFDGNLLNMQPNEEIHLLIICGVNVIDSIMFDYNYVLNNTMLYDTDNDPTTADQLSFVVQYVFSNTSCNCNTYSSGGALLSADSYFLAAYITNPCNLFTYAPFGTAELQVGLGSGPFYGCLDSLATNYDPLASCNDGCVYPLPPAENLFFSEYAEGSSNNKYFEIYNPTSDTIDLTNYAFARVSNSPTTTGIYEYWVDFDSAAIILPNDVYVVVHPSSDSLLLAEADMDYGSLSNGDDGFALVYGNNPGSPMSPSNGSYEILDWIGDWNGDPGQGWDVAGVGAATRNHTLVRKCPIFQGDTSWTNAAGTDPVNSQWIVLSQNDWTNIGFHNTCVCDSSTNSYTSIIETICNGLSIMVGNSTYDSTGLYSDTLLAFNGCDSVITTNLTVLSSSASNVINDVTICDGDSIVVGSNVYNSTGSYIDILTNSSGCDSTIISNITVQTPVNQIITICDGDSVIVGNSVYSTAGIYTDTIQSFIGCDSIVHTNLIIYSQFNSIFEGISNNTIGTGDFYSGSQHLEMSCYLPSELVSALVYAEDTIVETFEIRDNTGNVLYDTLVSVIPGGQRIYFNYDMSSGSNYQLGVNGNSNDLFRNNSGVNYPYNFGALASITTSSAGANYYYFFYDIEVKQSSLPTNYSICDGESITVVGNIYNTTGLYTDSLTSSIGCDSLVFTNLVVYPNASYSNNQTICSGETYLIGGNIYDSTGIYVDSLYTQYGCDSIITTILIVNNLIGVNVVNQQAICSGDSITVGSNIYFDAGVFLDTLTSSNGCDSIVTTTLTILTANYASIFGGIPDTSIANGNFYSGSQYLELSCYEPSSLISAVVYSKDTVLTTFEVRDDNGAVLKDTTINVIPGGHRIYFNYTMSVGVNYELGISGTSDSLFRSDSGISYPYNFSSAAAVTSSSAGSGYYYFFYDIEVMPSVTYNNYSICEGDSIVVGTNVYYGGGNYTNYFAASNGCDSVVYTSLEVSLISPLTIGSAPSPAEICLGDTIILEASSGFDSYIWNNGMASYLIYDVPLMDTEYTVSALDSNGCVTIEDITVYVDSCISALDELSLEQAEFQIYPNPVSEQLTINFTGKATSIKVYNMLGELVIEKPITEGESSIQLFVKEWNGAMYNLQLYRENGPITRKVFTVVR